MTHISWYGLFFLLLPAGVCLAKPALDFPTPLEHHPKSPRPDTVSGLLWHAGLGVGGNYAKVGANVSMEIDSHQIVGLLGPNGAGKTTLISAVCGLLELDAGEINVLGHNALTEREKVIPHVNLVTGFAGLLNDLSVEDLMQYYAMLFNVPDKAHAIAHALHATGLDEKKSQIANTLSSGYRQRFYIAKALLSKPSLLLLDEPTVGLDVFSARNVRALISRLRDEGMAILLTTHYMAEAEELCDRIYLINKGTILAEGTAIELKKRARLETGSLEDAFVELAHEDWMDNDDE